MDIDVEGIEKEEEKRNCQRNPPTGILQRELLTD